VHWLLHALCLAASCSEKLRAKLEQDRRERRRKLGLPEELTEEEKAKEAEKARKKAEEEAARHYVYVKPISGELRGVVIVWPCCTAGLGFGSGSGITCFVRYVAA
jgi:hypothetical protein